jgi:hypothetical protein
LGYNLLWMIVQDMVKLGLYGILDPASSWKTWLFEPLRSSDWCPKSSEVNQEEKNNHAQLSEKTRRESGI